MISMPINGWAVLLMCRLGLEEIVMTEEQVNQYNLLVQDAKRTGGTSIAIGSMQNGVVKMTLKPRDPKLVQELFKVFNPDDPKKVIITGPPGGYYGGDKDKK